MLPIKKLRIFKYEIYFIKDVNQYKILFCTIQLQPHSNEHNDKVQISKWSAASIHSEDIGRYTIAKDPELDRVCYSVSSKKIGKGTPNSRTYKHWFDVSILLLYWHQLCILE